jgi:hypothetical protein
VKDAARFAERLRSGIRNRQNKAKSRQEIVKTRQLGNSAAS